MQIKINRLRELVKDGTTVKVNDEQYDEYVALGYVEPGTEELEDEDEDE